VEGNGLGLDLALLHIDLVAAENDRDIFADSDKIACIYELAWAWRRSPLEVEDVRCQLGTFLYVILEVTSNMMMPH
jgi:hypothetical protein